MVLKILEIKLMLLVNPDAESWIQDEDSFLSGKKSLKETNISRKNKKNYIFDHVPAR